MRRRALWVFVCVYEALLSGPFSGGRLGSVEVRVLPTIDRGRSADVPVYLLGENERL